LEGKHLFDLIDFDGERKFRVAVVDDEPNNRLLFKFSLTESSFELVEFENGIDFIEAVDRGEVFSIVLLDVMMPRMDGFQVCHELRARPLTQSLPVILVTGLDDTEYRIRGLECGADDYLSKPFHPLELKARMRALLKASLLTEQLTHKNRLLADEKIHLEQIVSERTHELENITMGLVAALEKANEMNDTDTGRHIIRVSKYSEILAEGVGMSADLVSRITRFASLHDVGKVGISDHVLKKPGRLTPEEFDEMKQHTQYGHELLKLANVDPIGQNIALCHHERFDGSGYPAGLVGEAIPLEARVVALADVFDALTTKRCYKDSYDLVASRDIIVSEAGKHFQESLVQVHLDNWERFVNVFKEYGEKSE
jgi:cyclic di-GMP phosphodiesterase